MSGSWPWKACKSKCYGKIGCFSVESPFTNSQGILPLAPNKVGVSFLVFNKEKRRRPLIVRTNLKGIERVNGTLNTTLIIHGWKDRGRNIWVKALRRALVRKVRVLNLNFVLCMHKYVI